MVPAAEGTPIRQDGTYFLSPANARQRQYETLRAYLVEGLSREQAAARFGYTAATMASLVRDFRAGHLDFFGPRALARRRSPAKERARARIVELRQAGHSAIEISAALTAEGMALNRTGVAEVLAEEGFTRLTNRPFRERVLPRRAELPRAQILDFHDLPPSNHSMVAGLLLTIPDLVALGLPALVRTAGYPSTRSIAAINYILSLLALKLVGTRRVSHVDDLAADPGAALFAGLTALPKTTALTTYSYRGQHEHQRALLAALDTSMIKAGLITTTEMIFDLDFHAIMHWGTDPALEKNYVPTRSQRSRSVLTFFAQDSGTHNLVYANADLAKNTQNREVIAFCDHWRQVSGTDPHMLVMDQKMTTQPILGELDARGVKFLTLRMRSAALIRQIDALPTDAWTTVALDRDSKFRRPKVAEQSEVTLSNYPGTVRQLIITGLGRDAPTVIITNDHDTTTKKLIERYARRMCIEQRLAEAIRAFHLDALAGAVNLNIDLDVALSVTAGAVCAALRKRLPGYATATPDTLQRRFIETSGKITHNGNHTTVRLDRRTYSPVLRQSDIPTTTTVPWWNNRELHIEYT
jgi:transposase